MFIIKDLSIMLGFHISNNYYFNFRNHTLTFRILLIYVKNLKSQLNLAKIKAKVMWSDRSLSQEMKYMPPHSQVHHNGHPTGLHPNPWVGIPGAGIPGDPWGTMHHNLYAQVRYNYNDEVKC